MTSSFSILCAKSGSLLIFFGLLTGLNIAAVMTGQIDGNPNMVVAAHLNALLGGFWLLGIGWTLPHCTLSSKNTSRMLWLLIIANYANWFLTAIKASFDVHGVDITDDLTNNIMFVFLTLFVVIPSILGSVMWVWGIFHDKPRSH